MPEMPIQQAYPAILFVANGNGKTTLKHKEGVRSYNLPRCSVTNSRMASVKCDVIAPLLSGAVPSIFDVGQIFLDLGRANRTRHAGTVGENQGWRAGDFVFFAKLQVAGDGG